MPAPTPVPQTTEMQTFLTTFKTIAYIRMSKARLSFIFLIIRDQKNAGNSIAREGLTKNSV